MQSSRQLIETLIRRIQSDTCSPEEQIVFRNWMAALDLSDPFTEILPEEMNQLKARMHQQLIQEIQAAPVVAIRRPNILRRYLTAAAVVAAIASGLLFWYFNSRQKGQGSNQAMSYAVIDNDGNKVRKITMPDGTIIWLNRRSRLEFNEEQYNREQRYVKLSGEGFFEVTKDAARPFIVETGNIYTRVLGTSFNIEAYQQESEIRVSLVHGKVSLEDKATAATMLLAPDQTMRYSRQTGQWQMLPMAVSNIEQWTSGALVFNEVPLEEALTRIAERFQLSIDYDKKLIHNKRITAAYAVTNWQSALHNVLFVHGLDFTTRNGQVVITR